MPKNIWKKSRKWFGIVLIVYLASGIALYFLQEKLLFHPEKLPQNHVFNFPAPFKEINLALDNQTTLDIVQFTVPDSNRKGVVLYFHGNMENIEHYALFASNFTRNKYEVWMMDYPGFGKSTGERTEQTMYNDAKEIYKMARARFAKDSIIIYGKSIGTGVASFLASAKDCKRLVLETPYCSINALFAHYAFIYPVNWMTKYHFPTDEYLKKVDAPVTIFHGTDDGVIPYNQSKRLIKIAKPGAELVTIEKGGHNNLNDFPLFQQKLDSVLAL